MLSLKSILRMSPALRVALMSTIFFAIPSVQQTYTICNPTQQQCPPDPALGKSEQIYFTSGASDQFTTQGSPTYGSNGAAFAVAQSGDAPTIISKWYIMFGHVEYTMQAAPGVGMVSSAVLQSDDLDEIDFEWLGAQDGQVQTNYFGKGQTTSYDRATVVSVDNTQGSFHTYTVDWTEEQIVWQVDGTTVRVLTVAEANGQYPQTPMQLKIGSWAGGDPSNPAGTIAWSGGDINFSAGPYTMYMKSISVTDYSTGTQYTYGNTSGDWESIESTGGSVNGNAGGSVSPTVASSAEPASTSLSTGNPGTGSSTCIWRARCSDGTSTVTLVSATSAAPTLPRLAFGGLYGCIMFVGLGIAWIMA